MGVREDRLVESVLFSAGKPVSVEDIKNVTGLSTKEVSTAVESLMKSYSEDLKNKTSLEIVHAGNKFAMQVKKRYTEPSMMIAKPEIESEVLKTLALIAFHQPVKQSNLRHMIGQKVYEHVDELVGMRLVHSKPHGATELLSTTRLFPEYFGLDSTKPEEIRQFLAKKVIGSVVEQEKQDADEPSESGEESRVVSTKKSDEPEESS